MPQAARNNDIGRFAGHAPVEIRNGIARFESGDELSLREVTVRSNTAREIVDETTGSKSRTVDVIWTTGATVLRYDWYRDEFYNESLQVDEDSIDLGRMNDGAPLLNSHWSYSLEDVLGRVEKVWIEDGVGYATVRFSNRSDVDDIWMDVRDGIIGKISVGYRVRKWEITKAEGKITEKRAVDWEPYEISLVAIPADSGCSVREDQSRTAPANTSEVDVTVKTEGSEAPASVSNEQRNDQAPAAPAAAATETTTAAPEASGERTVSPDAADITRYAAANSLDVSVASRAIEEGVSFADFVRANLKNEVSNERKTEVSINADGSGANNQRSFRTEMELRGEMFTAELLDRTATGSFTPSDQARQYAGHGQRGAAIAYLRSMGEFVDERASDASLVEQALKRSVGGGITSSDFLAIYAKPAQAVIDQSWKETIPETNWQRLAGQMPMTDFDGRQVFSMSLFNGIAKVSEDGELPLASMSGNSYTAKTDTHGIKIALTVQALIRDNIGMFMEGMRDLGITWNFYNEALFMNVLENGYVNSSDGKRKIFSQAAGNLVNITDLDEDNLEKMVIALRTQSQSPKLGGIAVRTAPRYLIVSYDLERKARKLTAQINATKASDVQAYTGIEVVVVDSFKEKTCYLAGANGIKGMIKRAFLQGNGDPRIERLAMTSALRVDWESYQHSNFVGASHLGAVKAVFPA